MNFEQILEREIIHQDCYNLKNFSLEDDCTIIDVGANIGIFSKYISELYPKSKVFSYELVERNYKEAKERLKNFRNVCLENQGVIGDSNPHGIFLHESNRGGHKVIFDDSLDYLNKDLFEKANGKQITKEEFSYKRFSQILQEINCQIDLFKLDCEGGEYDILFQCDRLDLFKKIDTIVMEVHGRHTDQFSKLKEILLGNYKYFSIKHHLIHCSNIHKF